MDKSSNFGGWAPLSILHNVGIAKAMTKVEKAPIEKINRFIVMKYLPTYFRNS